MPRPRSTLFPYTTLFRSGLKLSPVHSVLIEMSVLGWKEYELEVMRDVFGNFVVRSEERFSRNAETEIYTLSLHDALPIWPQAESGSQRSDRNERARLERVRTRSDARRVRKLRRQIGRAVQQECRDRDLHSFPTRRSSDLASS